MENTNIQKIRTFLEENKIEYTQEEDIFTLKKDLQIRYADSKKLKIGYPKFGYEGKNTKYLYEISKKLEDEGCRVIWWHDFECDILRKNNVIKSYILSACGKVKNRVYARDCVAKNIPSKELKVFLNNNCFYGYRSASLNVGLYTKKDIGEIKKDTLVMMWSIGHAFFGKKLYDMEIIRASTILNTQVIGGQSKLFSHINNIPAIQCGKNLITWNSLCFYVDYDHNNGNSLPVIGFKFLNYSKGGFMNINLETNESFNRKPMQHKLIMQQMREGKVISTPLAGVKTYIYCRNNDYSKYGIISKDV